ncbi:MAG: DUF523 domain-containing protein [Candidatus Izemoplasmatales bacterium]|nr:DUF523 domain-containing protein [Candidatus Izemoplasmatales bacterium]MDD4595620.1 DUF523 domain-containing protein [Candidatus Izemoplasmatales bacterium]
MKKIIAVSACLLGCDCKYNGGSNLDENVIQFVKGYKVVSVCPEVLGGMTTPRKPSEIQPDGSVMNKIGEDVSAYFDRGKLATLAILKQNNCTEIILKDGSPSCGYTQVYDGTFTYKLISGKGITTQYLTDNGITIVDFHKIGQR